VLAHLVLLVSLWLGVTAVSAPGAQPHVTSPAAPARLGLHVAGNRLLDSRGSTVVLRGVNISGTEFACAQGGSAGSAGWSIFGGQPEDTPSTISAIQQWHANVVRIPLNEDCWLGINGVSVKFGGQAYRAAILKFVQDLTGAGTYVIVDLHWSAPGPALALSQQPMADEDHAPGFWTSVATTFATDANVIFDLYNEPFLYASYFQSKNQDSWLCWLAGCTLNQYLTGGQPYTKPRSWRTAGMQEMIEVVRATGATNVVIANGLNWANDDSGWLAHMPHPCMLDTCHRSHRAAIAGCGGRNWRQYRWQLQARQPAGIPTVGRQLERLLSGVDVQSMGLHARRVDHGLEGHAVGVRGAVLRGTSCGSRPESTSATICTADARATWNLSSASTFDECHDWSSNSLYRDAAARTARRLVGSRDDVD
jgi:hypothetical protein